MNIFFTKYHGIGNDYLFIDLFDHSPIPEDHLPNIAIRMSHRRHGVGADGIVLVQPSRKADAQMRIFNSDGSEAETCGNALRCIARMLWEKGYISKTILLIDTPAGIVEAKIMLQNELFHKAAINMGRPIWAADDIPIATNLDPENVELFIREQKFKAVCVSVGNPHCILFVPEIVKKEVLIIGPQIEKHDFFPKAINVGFCRLINRKELELAVWERGSGWTEACGSGATAAFAAARKQHLVDTVATVNLPGGSLKLSESTDGSIIQTGPAQKVFSGNIIL